jgi:hypothetical protein
VTPPRTLVCDCESPRPKLDDDRTVYCHKCGRAVLSSQAAGAVRVVQLAFPNASAGATTNGTNGGNPGSNGFNPPAGAVPRIALTHMESAQSLGCGLTYFKTEIAPHLPTLRHNSKPVYLVSDLQKYAEENAEPPMIEQLGEGKS